MTVTTDPAAQPVDPAYADLLTRAALRKSIWQSDLSHMWKLYLIRLCEEADAHGMVTIDFAIGAVSLGIPERRFAKRIRRMTFCGFLRPVGSPSSSGGVFYLTTRR